MKRSISKPPVHDAQYRRVVDDLMDSFRAHASEECRGDRDCLQGFVTVGMVRQVQALGIVPAAEDPAQEERLLVDRLVTDALRRLEEIEGRGGGQRRDAVVGPLPG